MTTTRKPPTTPTPAHRRALLAALADPKGRIPTGTNGRVLDAIHAARWANEVTNCGRAAWGARLVGYDGPSFLAINSRGRKALLTEAGRTALRAAGPDRRLPVGTPWPTAKVLHRDGLAEFRDDHGTVHPTDGDDGVRGPLYAPYATDLGHRVVTGFPQAHRSL
ncbi:hypothetical protein ACIQCR_16790 [Streptomyces sp. NPDC093249]|uniref:hypothetical protein n=1 Tax=unclassified Streptomyces TaxID=2593676 RepID=UPI00382BEBDD